MPIRFRCEHCRQKLSVAERKAGRQAICPKCSKPITIPVESQDFARTSSEPASVSAATSTSASADPSEKGDASSGLPADSDSTTWIYIDEEPRRPTRSTPIEVRVPRRVIFVQGLLLISLGGAGFVLGRYWERRTRRAETSSAIPRASTLQGTVTFASRRGETLPDNNAAVIVLPVERNPGPQDRPDVAGLRPDDPFPLPGSEVLRVLQLLGGAYQRTAAGGRYRVELPSGGPYFVLVLSQNASRPDDEVWDKSDLAQIGRYFLPVSELLQDRAYEWRQIEVDGQTTMDVTF